MADWARDREDARREAMLKELASDLAELVRLGEITDTEANVWLAHKADAWAQGLS